MEREQSEWVDEGKVERDGECGKIQRNEEVDKGMVESDEKD